MFCVAAAQRPMLCLPRFDGVSVVEDVAWCDSFAATKGGEHDFAAAGFPLGSGIGGSGCDARLWAGGRAHGCASQWRQGKRRIRPGFLRYVGPRLHPRLRAAGVGPHFAGQPLAALRCTTASRSRRRLARPRGAANARREQPPRACRRLHQSDLEARGSGSREEARRNVVGRRGRSEPAQSVLASRGAFYFHERRNRSCRSRTRSRSFTTTIIKSVTCA